MALFGLGNGPDINDGVREFRDTPGAVLLDVRSEEERQDGFIPGSINIPLNQLPKIESQVPDKDTPLFVHCLSGARSSKAVAFLGKIGYSNAKNIGGINLYDGPVEK